MAGLRAALGDDATITPAADGSVYVTGVDTPTIGAAARQAGIVLEQLATQPPDLEEAFLALTRTTDVTR